ncbi:MAG: 6-phosphogluconate dehydrogenase [Flavobacteriales bacterium]
MKKAILWIFTIIIISFTAYYTIVYYVHFSEGYRSGELVKITNKGLFFKTWEGELSQGISESHRFIFSVETKDTEVIRRLKKHQGKQLNLTYIERLGTFPWLGDSNYFVKKVELVEVQ